MNIILKYLLFYLAGVVTTPLFIMALAFYLEVTDDGKKYE